MDISCKALLLDLSGVVWEGDTRVDGALETIEEARSRGLTLRFVTNTATKSSADLLEKLERMGIEVDEEELFTAPKAARRYIEEKGLRPYCLIHEAIRPEFSDLDQENPNCVLLGDARSDLNYDSLNVAFRLCHSGAELIGIGMNRYFKDEKNLCLDAGPFIRAIEWAAEAEAVIMGKPSAAFFEQVVASTGDDASDCLMVGDDVEGDVIGAIDAGLEAVLVKTGKFGEEDLEKVPERAAVVKSIAKLFQ